MNKCKKCNLEILDDSIICPLCSSVLETSSRIEEDEVGKYDSHSIMYPNVAEKQKKLNLILKIIVFVSVIVELLLVLINYLTYKKVWWSLICGAALLFICFTLIYSVQRNTGIRMKLFVQMLATILLIVILDHIIGYTGWSVNFGVPSIILVLDVVVMIFIIADNSNWQSYIMLQLMLCVVSVISVVHVFADVVTKPILTIVTAVITGLILIGIIVFGDKKATNELFKRFRI